MNKNEEIEQKRAVNTNNNIACDGRSWIEHVGGIYPIPHLLCFIIFVKNNILLSK